MKLISLMSRVLFPITKKDFHIATFLIPVMKLISLMSRVLFPITKKDFHIATFLKYLLTKVFE